MNLLEDIKTAKINGKKLLAILIDPDKVNDSDTLIANLKSYPPDLLFVGGSSVERDRFHRVIEYLFKAKICPVVIFPGDYEQISSNSDAILMLSLISGRNPEYLIGQHVKAAPSLENYDGEVIPTSYILIDGNKITSVQTISETSPIGQENIDLISNTVVAGKLLGHQLHYLEAGSGAENHVSEEIVAQVAKITPNPIIVGGGIRNVDTANKLWKAGADLIVVGNGFEEKSSLLQEIVSSPERIRD